MQLYCLALAAVPFLLAQRPVFVSFFTWEIAEYFFASDPVARFYLATPSALQNIAKLEDESLKTLNSLCKTSILLGKYKE